MININNLFNNENIKLIASGGQYFVYEHQRDLSVSPWSAVSEYFMKEMNCKKRQVLVQLNNSACKTQAGAMQWVAGNIQTTSGVTGVGNFLGKMVKGAVTGESGVKPEYTGQGFVMLEPTYNYILIEDIAQWGPGVVLDDGLFLCCDMSLQESITKRSNVSSAVLGGEGLFNLTLSGQGYAVLESPVPREELIEFNLENDVLKIDGNMAIAWSKSLQFTVETITGKALGSAATGEGFVNVYRGTGKVLMAPTIPGTTMSNRNGPEQTAKTSSNGIAGSVASSLFNL
ncbi:MAG: AIM24 family protein [Eubacterium sp.]|nr:AIM24 family protein [Eubacterium sp.]